MLLAYGAETKLTDSDSKTPFALAAANAATTPEHAAVAAILLEASAGVRGQDEKGWTALLHWALLSQDKGACAPVTRCWCIYVGRAAAECG